MRPLRASWKALPILALSTLPVGVLGGDVISTDGFTTCLDDPTITVTAMDISYDRTTTVLTYNVAGTSSESQNVTGDIVVTAYGTTVYSKYFDPCESGTYVEQLCPVPAGTFSAQGHMTVDSSYTSVIPSIAFTIPDLDGAAKLSLTSSGGTEMACIESTVTNGKTMNVAAVQYVSMGIAGGALALSAIGSVMGGMHVSGGGATAPSPTFSEVFGWFQGMATNGMLTVAYPTVYQSFTKNFAFSTGLIPWGTMQTTIDDFRKVTGGNLTEDSYDYLQNATLVYSNGANSSSSSSSLFRRNLDQLLFTRDSMTTSVNGTTSSTGDSSSNSTSSTESDVMHYVKGMQAYVEQLTIPQANTFMTVLLIVAIVIAAITVGILLLKVILEAFALGGNLPKSLESFRKRYWWRLAKTITNLVLLLYGIWTLYCVYQFTNGDSWAAKVLAGVTWSMFTGILLFFTVKICLIVRKLKKMEGDHSGLYENKETWVKYSLFYENFKKGYWWLFIPSIIYMFAKNAVVAGANGHGLVQTIGQGVIEVCMLALLCWNRPYGRKSGNVINIIIQVVRVISIICVLVFVEELGIAQTTKTVTGVVLIVVQGSLTAVLAILIAVNAIVSCVRMNPHRQRRKAAEKLNRDLDNLTPLHARNSLLMSPTLLTDYKGAHAKAEVVSSLHTTTTNDTRYDPVSTKRPESPEVYEMAQRKNFSRPTLGRDESREGLMSSAASFGGHDRSPSPPGLGRKPTLPNVELRSYR